MKEVITYRTAGGSTVVWAFDPKVAPYGRWVCEGCGDKGHSLSRYANQHASQCWAC